MKIAHAQTTEWKAPSTVRGGVIRFKNLLEGDEGSLNNYSLVLADTDTSFKSPRHRHNFDQIRITLQGSTNFGPKRNIDVGDVAYFPEGTHYGPQDQSLVGASSVAMVIQFGGASGNGYMSQRQLFEGQRELAETGRFENGVYRREQAGDGERKNQDAYEAIWEHRNGRPLEYPRPRLTDPVHFRAANVPWYAAKNLPGVSTKDLGEFTERHVRLRAWRLEAGTQFDLPASAQERILFFTSGTGEIGDGHWQTHSAIHLAANESPRLHAGEASEFVQLEMPLFEGADG